jgi:hypothetical protein
MEETISLRTVLFAKSHENAGLDNQGLNANVILNRINLDLDLDLEGV